MLKEAVAAGNHNLVAHRKVAVEKVLEVVKVVMLFANRIVSDCCLRPADIDFDSEEPQLLGSAQTSLGTTVHCPAAL